MSKLWVLLFLAMGQGALGELPDAPNKVHPLMVGDEIPALTLTDADGQPFDLGKHKKPTVLIFYRGHW